MTNTTNQGCFTIKSSTEAIEMQVIALSASKEKQCQAREKRQEEEPTYDYHDWEMCSYLNDSNKWLKFYEV